MNTRAVAVFISLVMLSTARGSYIVPNHYHKTYGHMCVADLTGDGTPDTVMGFNGKVAITSELGVHWFDTPGMESDAQCANIVGSPLPDAVVVRAGRFTIVTFTRDGTWEQIDMPISIGTARALLVGDMDQDGLVDAIAGSHDSGAYLLRAVDGEGTFEEPVHFHTSGTNTLAWYDHNHDNFPDVALGTPQGVAVRVNDGNGGFLPAAATAGVGDNSIWGMWTGDFSGDGQASDIVVTTWNGYLAHFHVQPNGDVQKVTEKVVGQHLYRIAVFDADGDGALDIITTEHRVHKLLLAYDYEAGVGWSTAEFPTDSYPREVIPTLQTLNDGTVEALVLHQGGLLNAYSLTGFDTCPLASPTEWDGSSFPLYLPAISQWDLRDSLATVAVSWAKAVERRTLSAFIKPPSGEEPTCVLGAPQMSVDTCEVTASGTFELADLMSNVCGRHSRIVNEEENEVYLVWDVVVHTSDSTPLQLGNGDVIEHETRFVSQLPVGFTLPSEIDVQFAPLEIHGPAWVTAALLDVSPTENTGIVRATYAVHSPSDTRIVLDSASNVHTWTWGECEEVDGRCVNTLTVDVSVCTGSTIMELAFTLYCGDEPCPNGHDSMTTTALITQQDDLCRVHLEGIEIGAATAVAEGQDVAMVGEELTGRTTLTARDRDGHSVAIVDVDLDTFKLCARETHDDSLADPCTQTPHRLFAWEHGQPIAGTEDLAVRVDTEQGSEGELLVDITVTLARENIPSAWVGLHLYAVATLNNFAIDGAKRAVRDSLLPHEASVVMRIVLDDEERSGETGGENDGEGEGSDDSESESKSVDAGLVAGVCVGAACGVLALVAGIFVWQRRRRQHGGAPARAGGVEMGAVQA